LEPGIWGAVILSLVVYFFVLLPQFRLSRRKAVFIKGKKRKEGGFDMSGEAFKKYIGQDCQIITMLEGKINGKISAVEGNWVEIEEKNNKVLINTEYIERFILPPSRIG